MAASIQSIAFIVLAALLLVLAGLAMLRIGLLRLESPLGIVRDGLAAGEPAPRWRRRDLAGHERQVPGGRWQLLVFTDHSVREFPGLVDGIRELCAAEPELEALLLPNRQPELAAEAIAVMGLDIPVVGVDRDFYWRHNVRVMPFILILDATGTMRAGGLANDAERLWMIWHLSQVPGRAGTRGPGQAAARSRVGRGR